jgi:hypothetical protein
MTPDAAKHKYFLRVNDDYNAYPYEPYASLEEAILGACDVHWKSEDFARPSVITSVTVVERFAGSMTIDLITLTPRTAEIYRKALTNV